MKIIYSIGNKVDSQTIMKKGILDDDTQRLFIKSDDAIYFLEDLKSVEKVKINGLGTMIKVISSDTSIFLAVPRLFIDKGTGFAIINYFATIKAYNLLLCALNLNDKSLN